MKHHKDKYLNAFIKPSFLYHITKPLTMAAHALNADYLAASNGICTKRGMARFGLLLFENEVNK